MSDETQVVTPQPEAVPAAVSETAQTFPAEYVQQLRQEAASYRTKLREIEEAQKTAEQKRLEQQQEWQTLAEQRAAEVEALRPYQEKYTAMLESVKTGNEKRIEQVPDVMRSLIPPIDDPVTLGQWLDANWTILTGKPPVPTLNGGAGQTPARTQTVVLTDAELQIAHKMGLTAEQYLAAKQTKR